MSSSYSRSDHHYRSANSHCYSTDYRSATPHWIPLNLSAVRDPVQETASSVPFCTGEYGKGGVCVHVGLLSIVPCNIDQNARKSSPGVFMESNLGAEVSPSSLRVRALSLRLQNGERCQPPDSERCLRVEASRFTSSGASWLMASTARAHVRSPRAHCDPRDITHRRDHS